MTQEAPGPGPPRGFGPAAPCGERSVQRRWFTGPAVMRCSGGSRRRQCGGDRLSTAEAAPDTGLRTRENCPHRWWARGWRVPPTGAREAGTPGRGPGRHGETRPLGQGAARAARRGPGRGPGTDAELSLAGTRAPHGLTRPCPTTRLQDTVGRRTRGRPQAGFCSHLTRHLLFLLNRFKNASSEPPRHVPVTASSTFCLSDTVSSRLKNHDSNFWLHSIRHSISCLLFANESVFVTLSEILSSAGTRKS